MDGWVGGRTGRQADGWMDGLFYEEKSLFDKINYLKAKSFSVLFFKPWSKLEFSVGAFRFVQTRRHLLAKVGTA